MAKVINSEKHKISNAMSCDLDLGLNFGLGH